VIVVDASVLIAHLDERDAHHARALELLLGLASHPLGASPITIAEVLVGPADQGRLDDARDALDAMGLREVPFGASASRRLALLRSQTRLKLPDCCVILAAEDAPAEAILTFDARLDEAAASRGLRLDAP
jgi:predicted nucleic acid-binding protein